MIFWCQFRYVGFDMPSREKYHGDDSIVVTQLYTEWCLKKAVIDNFCQACPWRLNRWPELKTDEFSYMGMYMDYRSLFSRSASTSGSRGRTTEGENCPNQEKWRSILPLWPLGDFRPDHIPTSALHGKENPDYIRGAGSRYQFIINFWEISSKWRVRNLAPHNGKSHLLKRKNDKFSPVGVKLTQRKKTSNFISIFETVLKVSHITKVNQNQGAEWQPACWIVNILVVVEQGMTS